MAKASGLFPTSSDIRKLNERRDGGDNDKGSMAEPASLMLPPPPPTILTAGSNEYNVSPQGSRLAKLVILSGYDAEAQSIEMLTKLFITLLLSITDSGATADSVKDCFYANGSDKTKLVIELAKPELATIAVAFDGVALDESEPDTTKFSITRPEGYIIPLSSDNIEGAKDDKKTKFDVEGPFKGSMSNIPTFIGEEQILELLKAFGQVRFCKILTDVAGNSKGVAFFEYEDTSILDIACQGLNNMALGDNQLIVRKACVGLEQSQPVMSLDTLLKLCQDNDRKNEHPPTSVMQLWNAISPEELADDEAREEISAQIEQECSKFGPVESVNIPKENSASSTMLSSSIGGRIYVKFSSSSACKEAVKHLGGRKFTDRTIISGFYHEDAYKLGIL
ncbi:hypothetical protein AWJ20_2039 [Sugiyamaella lignohabitans]|uniref:RRM domain-containing protein n=1 Tax=Sugiyamaella lignohabitans TaxID=796027 RepID=A0A167ETY0_9ASCO|nr:uncharacterized protein AWJ20_2039 [Sugiyamaella lignohabitans]ANB14449.1 hypothetical protein AWJ20_2039 [Sugiyamaella lignohabitans]